MFASPRDRVRVRRSRDHHPGGDCVAKELGARGRCGPAARSSRPPCRSRAHLEQPLEIDGVWRAVLDDAPLRMADRPDCRMPRRFGHPLRQLLARLPLPGVYRCLHPVELGEHVVRQVEAPVVEDVALGAAQHSEWRERSFAARSPRPDVARRPRRVPERRGRSCVVADRDVVVAELTRRPAHLEHRRLAVGPRRVDVQVATHVGQLEQRAGARLGASRSSGGTKGRAERR